MRSVCALAVKEFNRHFSPTSSLRVAVAYILLQRSKRCKAFATAFICRLFQNRCEIHSLGDHAARDRAFGDKIRMKIAGPLVDNASEPQRFCEAGLSGFRSANAGLRKTYSVV